MSNNVSSLSRKLALVISTIAILVTLLAPNARAQQLIWACGMDDGGWPAGDGGGPNASFLQENGSINALPGNPISASEGPQGADNDYYFAGLYTSVIAGNGAYAPVGPVPVNEEGAERAFAAADNDLRYHFNLPTSLQSYDQLSVTYEAINLDDPANPANTDIRYGIEVYINNVLVQTQIVIRPAQLNIAFTTPPITLASVNAQTGPGYDNIVSLRGINYNNEGGGNWMGIDYVQLKSTAGTAPGAGGYAAAVLADGPIAYYRFNDAPPTAQNSGTLGAAANGTYTGGATSGSQAPAPPDFPGFEPNNTALQCNGTDAYVTAMSLMNGRPVFTISGWMRRNADQADRTGLWGQNDIVEFGYINNNTIELWTDNGLHQSPDPTVNPIPNGEWAHFAVVSDGSPGTAYLYTNGVLANSRAHTLPADNAFPFNIGGGGVFDAIGANGNYFNGQIDEVAVFDKAFTAGQIAAQYAASKTALTPLPNVLNIGGNKIGTVTPNNDGTITIVGGGNDIWSGRDEFTYAYKEVLGDFDVKVKVESLTPNATWSKAGIMVRESLSEFSRMAFPRVTPDTGANDTRFAYRTGLDNVNGESGGEHEDASDATAQRPANGHRWVRLVRAGAVLTASSSTDGSTWVDLGTQDTAAWGGGALGKSLYVGLGVSRHSGGPTATAQFSSFSISQPGFGMLQASSRGNPNAILVSFTKAPDAASLVPGSFDTVGLTISSISSGPFANSYWLNVDPSTPLVEGTAYTVTAFQVTAGGGTESPSPDSDTFTHGAGYEARRIRISHNKTSDSGYYPGSDAVAGGIGDVVQTVDNPAGFPAVEGNTVFEDPIPDTGGNERFASRISGVLDITTSGAYTFYMSSDDVGHLYLSTNEDPANKVQIANEPSWNGRREYIAGGNQVTRGVPPSNISAPITLTAGQKYYLELIFNEGGGGNNGSATWLPPGGAAVANGTEPIPEAAFAPSRVFGGSQFNNLGPVQIVRQPANQTVVGGTPVTFSAGVDGTPAYRFQWRRNGQAIAGATGARYTIPVTLGSDDGARFSVSVANEFSSAVSAEAVLTVNIPTPPVALSATPNTTFASLLVKFDKRLQLSSAQNTANYTISGGVTVNSATVDATGTAVVLTTSPQAEGATYTLTIRDVKEVTGNNALTPNPTTLSFQTLVFSPGFALKEYYQTWTAGGGSVDAFAAAVQAGTTSPTISCYVNLWQQNTADEYDNYGGRISGFFVPTADGPHVFYFASDDFGRLFLSTDENPANKVEIAREPVWSGRRTWVGEAGGGGRIGTPSASGGPQQNISGAINLLAGHRYYLEGVFTEGGGGDNMAVAVQGPGQPEPVNDSSPITAANIGTYASPVGASAAITQQPVDATRAEGTFATFTAAGSASSAACGSVSTFQWFRNGVPIIGANSPSLTYGPVTQADNGAMFKLRVAAVGAYADSAEARLTVEAPRPLQVVRAEGVCNLRQVRIVFDQFVDETTSQDVFNYTSDSFGISTAVRNPDNLSVTLTLDDLSASQTPGANYCVKVKGISSASGLPMDPAEVNACFQACVVSCGFARQEIYMGIGGVNISDLTAAPAYPNSPNITRYVGGLSANNGDEFDNYGTRITGYIIPPVSGGYVFYLASDDGGDFALSTDADPANLVPVAVEPVWASRRRFVGGDGDGTGVNRTGTASPSGGPQANISGTINLVAGQQYYFEARMKEGGGGDNLDVAWKVPGGAEPTVGSAPISGAFLASLANPAGASVTITTQPANQCAEVNTAATFTVGINATTGGQPTQNAFYQWYRMTPGGDWLPINGATSATYAPIVTLADNGNKYRVAIYVPGANATSAEATLSVYQLNTAPQFTGGPDQTTACAGSATVPGWATGIQPHSINRTPIQISYDFSTVPAGSTMINRVLDVNTNGTLIRDGILKLTDAINGSQGGFLTAALPTVIESFTVNFKLRMGGGTCCGAALPDGSGVTRPADGMSITIGDVQVPLSFPVAAEEGAAVGGGGGVVVAFDTWDNNGTDEAPAVDVKVGGSVIGFQSLDGGEREGGRPPAGPFITDPATGQPLSFQTGAQFVDVRIHLDADGTLDVDFKGVRVIDNLQTGIHNLTNARIAFGGRTGGANNNQWVDDLQITALPVDASSSEAGQSVQFVVTTDNPGLFASGPAISPSGTLSYTLAAGHCGSANVTAVLKDDGGTATCGTAVGQDTSAPYTFKISTAADTVPPVITCPANITADATSPAGAIVTYTATASDNCCLASVVCVPASGSTFPIGATAVTCTATDGAGLTATCTFSITVRDVQTNRPPIAVISSEQLIDLKPEYENPVLLSCNWWNACLVADGYSSSDPEGGALTYLWFADQDPVPFGAGPVVTNCLEVGTHTIVLIVTDPAGLPGTDSKTIEVVTAPLAIELLIEQIEESHKSGVVLSRKTKRELTETLRVALAHAGREELRATQKALDAFEKKVRAQVAPTEPEAATAWIRWSQAISDGMEKCIKPPRKGKDHQDDKKDDDDRDDKK